MELCVYMCRRKRKNSVPVCQLLAWMLRVCVCVFVSLSLRGWYNAHMMFLSLIIEIVHSMRKWLHGGTYDGPVKVTNKKLQNDNFQSIITIMTRVTTATLQG